MLLGLSQIESLCRFQCRVLHCLYRFDPKIVLVWADSGLLCQGGDHVVRPTGMAGYVVEYHMAGERANRKWFLDPQVYDV